MANVDQRIVEMKFDNHNFEANANKSISTLERLKQALNFDGALKSFNNIEKSLGNMSLNALSKSIDEVNSHFSAMGVAGMTVISNLTSAAMDFGKNALNSIIEPIKTGGWNRASNIAQAKFMLEGLNTAWDDIKGDIDFAVNGTAYGLDAAAKVAGQLVASNVQLGDEMAHALRAVSGVAAMTNSTYEDIGQIFATVASNGKLMTYQLRQLSWRGLNVAARLGKALGHTEEEINEMVTKGEISFKEFADVMYEEFGEHAVKANTTFTGSLANMKAAMARIGAEFVTPYQNAMIKVHNAAKDVFDDIKKNRLTDVFTEFSDFADKAGNFFANVIKNIDLSWVDNLAKKFETVTSLIDGVMSRLSPFWKNTEEEKEIVEETAEEVKDYDEVVKKVLAGEYGNGEERFKKLEEEGYIWEKVQNQINELLGIEKRYEFEEKEVAKAVSEVGEQARISTDKLYAMRQKEFDAYRTNRMFKKTFSEEWRTSALDRIETSLTGLKDGFDVVRQSFKATFKGAEQPLMNIGKIFADAFLDAGSNIGQKLSDFNQWMTDNGIYKKIENWSSTLFENVERGVSAVDKLIRFGLDEAGKKFDTFWNSADGGRAKISAFFDELKDEDWYQTISGWTDKIKQFFEDITDPNLTGEDIFNKIKETFTDNAFVEGLSSVVDTLNNFVSTLISNGPSLDTVFGLLSKIGLLLIGFNIFKGTISGINAIGTITASIAGIFENVRLSVASVRTAIRNFGEVIEEVADTIASVSHLLNAGAILLIAFSIKILADAFTELTQIDTKGLLIASGAMAVIAGVLAAMYFGLNMLTQLKSNNPLDAILEFFSKFGSTVLNVLNATAILEISGAIAIMAVAFKSLSEISVGGLFKAAAGIIVIAAALGVLFAALNSINSIKKENPLDSIKEFLINFGTSVLNVVNAGAIILLAGAIGILSLAFKSLASLDWRQVGVASAAIVVLTGCVAGLALALGIARSFKKDFGSFNDVLGNFLDRIGATLEKIGNSAVIASLAIFVASVANAINTLSQIDFVSGLKSVLLLGIMIAELIAAMKLLSNSGSFGGFQLNQFGMLLTLSYVVNSLGNVIKELSTVPLEDGIKSLALIGGLMAELYFVMKYFSKIGEADISVDATLAVVAFAVSSFSNVIKDLSSVSWGDGLKSLVMLGALLFELYFALNMLGEMGKSNMEIRSLATMAMLGIVVKILGSTISELSTIPIEDGFKSLAMIGALMFEVIGVLSIASRYGAGGISIKNAAFLASMAVSISILSSAIQSLAKIDGVSLQKAIFAIGEMGLIAVGLLALSSKLGGNGLGFKGIANMIPIIGLIAALTGSLMLLSGVDTAKLNSATNALSKIFGSLALFAFTSNGSMFNKGSSGRMAGMFIGFAALLAEIAIIFEALKDINPDQMLAISDSMSKLMGSLSMLSAAMGLFTFGGGFDFFSTLAIGAAQTLNVDILLANIVAIESVAAAVNNAFPEFTEFIKTGQPLLEAVGEGIGSFIGGIVQKGLFEPLSDTFKDLPTDLSTFITNLQPFLDGVKDINTTGFDNFTKIMWKLAEAEFASVISSVGRLFAGENSLQFLAEDIEKFGAAMASYSSSVEGINQDAVDNSQKTIDLLTGLANAVPPSGGLLQWITGEADLEDFGVDIVTFAGKMNEYAQACEDINFDKAADITSKVSDLFDVFLKLDDVDNAIYSGAGDNLNVINSFLRNFFRELDKINPDDYEIDSSVIEEVAHNIFDKLTESFSDVLSTEGEKSEGEGFDIGGIFEKALNNTTADDFAGNMTGLGQALADAVGQSISEANTDAITENLTNLIKGAIENAEAEVTGATKESGGFLSGIISGIFGGDKSGEINKSADSFGQGIIDSIGNALFGKSPDMSGFFSSMLGETDSSDLFTVNIGNNIANALKQSFEGTETDLSGFFTNLFSGTDTSSLTESAESSGIGENITNALTQSLEGTDTDLTGFFDSLFSGIDTSQLEASAEPVGESMLSAISNSFEGGDSTDISSSLISALQPALDDANNTIIGYEGTFTDSVTTIVDGCVSAIKSGGSGVISAVSKICNLAASAASGYYSVFYSHGKNMMAGLAAGIAAGTAQAVSAAQAAAQAVADAVASVSQIKSPSRVFYRFGRFDMEGLANGITDNTYLPVKAITKSAGIVIDSMQKSMSDVTDKTGSVVQNIMGSVRGAYEYINSVLAEGIDTTPRITPVVDLSNIQNGVNSLNGMFGSAGYDFSRSLSYATGMYPGSYLKGIETDPSSHMLDVISGIRGDIAYLGQTISSMRMVMDSGELVGSISGGVDRSLGGIQKYKDRWA